MDPDFNHLFRKEIADVMTVMVSTRSKLLNLTMFASFFDSNLHETGTEHVFQALRPSLAVATYAEKDSLLRKFFYTLLCDEQSFVDLINRG